MGSRLIRDRKNRRQVNLHRSPVFLCPCNRSLPDEALTSPDWDKSPCLPLLSLRLRSEGLCSMISQPWTSICQMNHPALHKSIFLKDMLHHPIIFVCINSQIQALPSSPRKAETGKALSPSRTGNPVNYTIGFMI